MKGPLRRPDGTLASTNEASAWSIETLPRLGFSATSPPYIAYAKIPRPPNKFWSKSFLDSMPNLGYQTAATYAYIHKIVRVWLRTRCEGQGIAEKLSTGYRRLACSKSEIHRRFDANFASASEPTDGPPTRPSDGSARSVDRIVGPTRPYNRHSRRPNGL